MRKSEKKKLMILCGGFGIIVILASLCFIKLQGNDEDILGTVQTLTGKYKTAYVKETDYKDTLFHVVYDDPSPYDENIQSVCFTPSNAKESGTGTPAYTLDVPPNIYIAKDFSADEYENIVGGYDNFQSSLQVITVIVPVDPEECNCSAYAFVTAQPMDRKVSKSDCVKKALKEVNSKIAQNSVQNINGDLVHLSKNDLKKYLEKYKFEKA